MIDWDKYTDKAGNIDLESAFLWLTRDYSSPHDAKASRYIRNVEAIQRTGNVQVAAVVLAHALMIYDDNVSL